MQHACLQIWVHTTYIHLVWYHRMLHVYVVRITCVYLLLPCWRGYGHLVSVALRDDCRIVLQSTPNTIICMPICGLEYMYLYMLQYRSRATCRSTRVHSRVTRMPHACVCVCTCECAHSCDASTNTCALLKLMRITLTRSAWPFFLRFSCYIFCN